MGGVLVLLAVLAIFSVLLAFGCANVSARAEQYEEWQQRERGWDV